MKCSGRNMLTVLWVDCQHNGTIRSGRFGFRSTTCVLEFVVPNMDASSASSRVRIELGKRGLLSTAAVRLSNSSFDMCPRACS
eukprot:2818602-Rhodomonas_salina.1